MKGWLRTEPKLSAPTDVASIYKVAYDIAEAMKEVHDHHVVHGVSCLYPVSGSVPFKATGSFPFPFLFHTHTHIHPLSAAPLFPALAPTHALSVPEPAQNTD